MAFDNRDNFRFSGKLFFKLLEDVLKVFGGFNRQVIKL